MNGTQHGRTLSFALIKTTSSKDKDSFLLLHGPIPWLRRLFTPKIIWSLKPTRTLTMAFLNDKEDQYRRPTPSLSKPQFQENSKISLPPKTRGAIFSRLRVDSYKVLSPYGHRHHRLLYTASRTFGSYTESRR